MNAFVVSDAVDLPTVDQYGQLRRSKHDFDNIVYVAPPSTCEMCCKIQKNVTIRRNGRNYDLKGWRRRLKEPLGCHSDDMAHTSGNASVVWDAKRCEATS